MSFLSNPNHCTNMQQALASSQQQATRHYGSNRWLQHSLKHSTAMDWIVKEPGLQGVGRGWQLGSLRNL